MTNSSSLARLDCLVREIKEGRRPLDLWSFLRVLLHHHVDAESAAHAESARRMAEFRKQAEALASLLATLHGEKSAMKNSVEVPAILQGLFDLQSARESLREYLKKVEAANAKPIWFNCAERLVAKRRAGQELGVEASGTPWGHLVGIVVGNCSTPGLDDQFVREWVVREKGYTEADPRAAELAQLNSSDCLLRDLLAEMRIRFPAEAKAWFGEGRERAPVNEVPKSNSALPSNPPADGPEPPNRLWWRGMRHELAPRLWALAVVLWQHDRVEIETAVRKVWKDEGEDVADGTIRSTLSQLNSKLTELKVPWTYGIKRGYIEKQG